MKRLLILVTFLGLTVHFCDVQGSAKMSQEALNQELIKAVRDAKKREDPLEKIRALLEAGANANAVGRHFNTVLMSAAQDGHLEVVRLLLQAGAKVDAADSNGTTALMYAAQGGHREVVELLLQADANANMVDRAGMTALMFAAAHGHLEVVKKLLLAGADVTIGDTMQELRRLPDSPTKRNILLVFDALKPGIEQELEDALKQESGQEQESEQVRPLKRQIIEAYEKFLHGNHAELRNLLLVLPDTMQKRMNGDHVFISFTVDAMLNVFKKESIKPLLYFLAEKQYQKNMADDFVNRMERGDQASLEFDSMQE